MQTYLSKEYRLTNKIKLCKNFCNLLGPINLLNISLLKPVILFPNMINNFINTNVKKIEIKIYQNHKQMMIVMTPMIMIMK